MKLQDLTFERIEHYDPLNLRAKKNGTISEWVARNSWGNAVAFGNRHLMLASKQRYNSGNNSTIQKKFTEVSQNERSYYLSAL